MSKCLYVVYDEFDDEDGLFDNLKDLSIFLNIGYKHLTHMIKHHILNEFDCLEVNKPKKYKVYKIDCSIIHDDIFKEEDELFISEGYLNSTIENILAGGQTISTYYRNKRNIKNIRMIIG